MRLTSLIYTRYNYTIRLQYQMLMTEAILCLYHLNSSSQLHCRRRSNNIHWILQIIGSSLAIAGMFVEFQLNFNQLLSIHTWTGNIIKKLKFIIQIQWIPILFAGLISGIFMIFGLVNGILSLCAQELRFFIRPAYIKFLHKIFGILTIIIGK